MANMMRMMIEGVMSYRDGPTGRKDHATAPKLAPTVSVALWVKNAEEHPNCIGRGGVMNTSLVVIWVMMHAVIFATLTMNVMTEYTWIKHGAIVETFTNMASALMVRRAMRGLLEAPCRADM